MKALHFTILLSIFLIIVGCRNNVRAAPPVEPTRTVDVLHIKLKELVLPVELDTVDLSAGDALIVVSYGKDDPTQIEDLGVAAYRIAASSFTIDGVDKVTVYAFLGRENSDMRHFISYVKGDAPVDASVTPGYVDCYEQATAYYIGPKVTGALKFEHNGESVELPVQKPLIRY